jgi:hypothetical protein
MARLLRRRVLRRPASAAQLRRPSPARGTAHYPVPDCEPYAVFKRPEVEWRGFLLDTEVRRASEATSRMATGRAAWGGVLVPRPRQNRWRRLGRLDLELSLRLGNQERYHTTLHRAVGLACLPCMWDDDGDLLTVPYQVTAHSWYAHEVHHLRGHSDCRLKALAVVTKTLHAKLSASPPKAELQMPRNAEGRVQYPSLVASQA